MFGKKRDEEADIRRRMIEQAVALADEQYKKDAAIRRLRAKDLTSTILQDLVNAAYYELKLTVKIGDGTVLTFERTDVQQELNRLGDRFGPV